MGQEFTDKEDKLREDPVSDAEERELSAWKLFEVCPTIKEGTYSKAIAATRSALTWKVVVGKEWAKARSVAEGYQAPDLKEAALKIAGCVGRRPSHVRMISFAVPGKWEIWSLDSKHACRHAKGFYRGVYRRAL